MGKTAGLLLVLTLALAGCGTAGSGAVDDSMLLPAQDMPVWNGAVDWTVGEPQDAPVLQACALPDLAELGASSQASQDYTWEAGGMGGLNVVAAFGSDQAAAEAAQLLGVHFSDCTGGGIISDLEAGSTWTTCTPVGGTGECRFEFAGVDAVDRYVTVVAFSLTAQDANYTEDPLIDSLEASTARISGS